MKTKILFILVLSACFASLVQAFPPSIVVNGYGSIFGPGYDPTDGTVFTYARDVNVSNILAWNGQSVPSGIDDSGKLYSSDGGGGGPQVVLSSQGFLVLPGDGAVGHIDGQDFTYGIPWTGANTWNVSGDGLSIGPGQAFTGIGSDGLQYANGLPFVPSDNGGGNGTGGNGTGGGVSDGSSDPLASLVDLAFSAQGLFVSIAALAILVAGYIVATRLFETLYDDHGDI